MTNIVPEGELVGWKKLWEGKIARLRIPAEAKRSNATGRKCRAEFAVVLDIWDGVGVPVEEGRSKTVAILSTGWGKLYAPIGGTKIGGMSVQTASTFSSHDTRLRNTRR